MSPTCTSCCQHIWDQALFLPRVLQSAHATSSFLAHPEGVMDLAPQEYWDCDILEEEGEKRFKSMIEEIKRGCAALQ